MNERYALSAELADLTGEFRLDRIEFPYSDRDSYEPTGQIPVIRQIGGLRCLGGQRWGLMPYWGRSSLHADRHSLGDTPHLLRMLARRRCVVPCSGLLLERIEGKNRTAVYRRKHATKKVFGAAGLFDVWLDSEKNEYPMCTIVTSEPASAGFGSVPLVLEGEAMDVWLDAGVSRTDSLRELLRSIPAAEFHTEPAAAR